MSRIIPNSFQYPNYYNDELMYLLSGDEQKVLLYTSRRIFGFHKEKDNISLTRFTDGTVSRDGQVLDHGTGLNRSAVIAAIEMLVKCKIIVEIPEDHSQAGKCYSLQLDSEAIDLKPLQERQAIRHQIGQRRTEKARIAPRQVVSGTDQQVVSGTDQQGSVGLTSGSQSDRPEVVSGTDTQINSRNTGETKGETKTPPPAFDVSAVWQEFFSEPLGIHRQTVLESEKIENEETFRAVLAIWNQNGYSPRNVSGMIERYRDEFSKKQIKRPMQAEPSRLAEGMPAGMTYGEQTRWLKERLTKQK